MAKNNKGSKSLDLKKKVFEVPLSYIRYIHINSSWFGF